MYAFKDLVKTNLTMVKLGTQRSMWPPVYQHDDSLVTDGPWGTATWRKGREEYVFINEFLVVCCL